MDFIYSALDYLATIGYTVLDFVTSIPDFFMLCAEYLVYLSLKLYIEFKISMIEFSYAVVQQLFADYEVYTFIGSAFNALPDSLRSAAYQFGVVQGIRIVVDAFGTAIVLRFIS